MISAINKCKSLSALHHQVLAKCTALWKLAGRPKSAEVMQDVLGCTLNRPGETRWNSLYDCLQQIYNIRDKYSILCKNLNIKNGFKENDFLYLKEYLLCVLPLAEALDILQGEKDMYYGIVLPCLLALRRKLQNLQTEDLKHCTILSHSLLQSVETRFYDFFNFSSVTAENAAIAALSYPRFKNRWFNCIDSHHQLSIEVLFKQKVASKCVISESIQTEQLQHNDDFFDFDFSSATSNGITRQSFSHTEIEVIKYFSDDHREISMLQTYPTIKLVFLHYNTPLPSSAPVERLFSYATMTNAPKSNKLSDTMFEKRVVLKSNYSKNIV